MSFRASLSVFLGFHFGQAKKLLNAANNGEEEQVKEVSRLLKPTQFRHILGFGHMRPNDKPSGDLLYDAFPVLRLG